VQAKQEYVRNATRLDTLDIKALMQAPLYGLPFLRVKVPDPTPLPEEFNPTAPQNAVVARDMPDDDVYLNAQASLIEREITFTSTYTEVVTEGLSTGSYPALRDIAVDDSFLSGQNPDVEIIETTMKDVPVLPQFAYDITALGTDGTTSLVVKDVAQVDASYTEIDDYTPKVTMIITRDELPENPTFPNGIDLWYPETIYSHTSVEQGGETLEQLLVTPAQYYTEAGDGMEGTMRLYESVTFKVTYVDPTAPGADLALADSIPPIIHSVRLAPDLPGGQPGLVGIAVEVSDSGTNDTGIADDGVEVSFTLDQQQWKTITLNRAFTTPDQEEVWSGFVPVIADPEFRITARDNAGNVAYHTGKGTHRAPEITPVPVESVSISGPATGTLPVSPMATLAAADATYAFTATVSPADASVPIKYTWSPEPVQGQGTATAVYSFTTTGAYSITVSARNIANLQEVVSASPHIIQIVPAQGEDGDRRVYLPLVRR
jgi:hypothetical protein